MRIRMFESCSLPASFRLVDPLGIGVSRVAWPLASLLPPSLPYGNAQPGPSALDPRYGPGPPRRRQSLRAVSQPGSQLISFTAQLQLETLFLINREGRLVSTREPRPSRGPRFVLIRSTTDVAWAVRADILDPIAEQIRTLAAEEDPIRDFGTEPTHAAAYQALAGGTLEYGPVFVFPDLLPEVNDVFPLRGIAQLERNFRGWTADEVPGCSPILAVLEGNDAISVCFCARRTSTTAEAGVETAPRHRGRGLALRVTAAWAQAIRKSGRLPLYSTSWSNAASLAVARKLALEPCATDWSLSD